jgi:L-alanine-DL-glutamate epimerase-like enolase superfamily enzyme
MSFKGLASPAAPAARRKASSSPEGAARPAPWFAAFEELPSRRELLASATAALLAPLRALAAAAKPVRIRNIEIFPIEITTPEEELRAGKYARYTFYLVETDAGVRGYAFDRESDYRLLDSAIRPALVGKDLFAIEEHLKAGLARWGGVEQAIWDAIGKIAGQPVHRLLGGSKNRLKVYLTVIWRGKADQSHVSFEEQAQGAVALKNAGYKGMKIRAWRPKPTDDADACGEIRRAVGPDFAIMVDRTANLPGLWDYSTGLRVARALEKHNVLWLEEPFSRDDFFSHARLAREVDILITGGERFHGLDTYRESLVQRSYDLLQPDTVIAGGIFLVRKIAALAQAFHVPLVLHGSMGLRLAGWLQASASFGAEWQELALITPPLMPEQQWSPALKVVRSKTLFQIRNGEIEVPQGPGLGLDIDEEAVRKFRIPEARSFYPMYEGEGRGGALTQR